MLPKLHKKASGFDLDYHRQKYKNKNRRDICP